MPRRLASAFFSDNCHTCHGEIQHETVSNSASHSVFPAVHSTASAQWMCKQKFQILGGSGPRCAPNSWLLKNRYTVNSRFNRQMEDVSVNTRSLLNPNAFKTMQACLCKTHVWFIRKTADGFCYFQRLLIESSLQSLLSSLVETKMENLQSTAVGLGWPSCAEVFLVTDFQVINIQDTNAGSGGWLSGCPGLQALALAG